MTFPAAVTRFAAHARHAYLRISTKPEDMPEDSLQTPQHPPKVTHRPERTWGILIKTKEGTDEIYTAEQKYQKSLPYDTRKNTRADILPEAI